MDKEDIIIAHRNLIKKLHSQILHHENNTKILRDIIRTLKEELVKQGVNLPEIPVSSLIEDNLNQTHLLGQVLINENGRMEGTLR